MAQNCNEEKTGIDLYANFKDKNENKSVSVSQEESKICDKVSPAKKKSDEEDGKEEKIDIMGTAAMENAYYICHNVQDLLYCRYIIYELQKV